MWAGVGGSCYGSNLDLFRVLACTLQNGRDFFFFYGAAPCRTSLLQVQMLVVGAFQVLAFFAVHFNVAPAAFDLTS